ncbi:MAG TPA: hypothetical protein VGP08_14985 [Pyrinomonadaceae bacterium]|jgi:hypothetical protein|nr:hypothetical protein [Pyrinomonadaceae bacterium]
MVEHREREFGELSARAEELLERPDVRLPHHRPLLRLWHYPSFSHFSSWLVCLPHARRDERPVVVESVWDRQFDTKRLLEPLEGLKHGFSTEPTISNRRGELPAEELRARVASLRRIAVPPFLEDDMIPLDGDTFGVETYASKAAARLVWWSERQEEWGPLVSWAEAMRSFLVESLDGLSL